MTKRISKEWEPDIFDAFGATDPVRKGKEAEDMYFDYAKAVYRECISHESDQEKQNQGLDFTIFKDGWRPEGFGVQVKLSPTRKTIKIDNTPHGWLRNPALVSNRIVLVDIKTGWAVDFRREEMIDFIDNWTPTPKSQPEVIINVFEEKLPKRLLHKINLLNEKHTLKAYQISDPKLKAKNTVEA